MGVEATSAEIERRIALSADLLDADRLAALIGQVRAAGGASLAGLLAGVDPDDPGVVEIVAAPIEAYAGLVQRARRPRRPRRRVRRGDRRARRLPGARGRARPSPRPGCRSRRCRRCARWSRASGRWSTRSPRCSCRTSGPQTLDRRVGRARRRSCRRSSTASRRRRSAGCSTRCSTRCSRRSAPSTTRSRRSSHAIDAAFQPIRDALHAIDLTPVHDALSTLMGPVQDAIDAIGSLIDGVAGRGAGGGRTTSSRALDAGADGADRGPRRDRRAVQPGALAARRARPGRAAGRACEQTIATVASAIGAAPVQPVFDVASGVIETAADALSLVPRSLLPDDVKAELDAALREPLEHRPRGDADGAPPGAGRDRRLDRRRRARRGAGRLPGGAGVRREHRPRAADRAARVGGVRGAARRRSTRSTRRRCWPEPLAALDTVRHALDGIDIDALLAAGRRRARHRRRHDPVASTRPRSSRRSRRRSPACARRSPRRCTCRRRRRSSRRWTRSSPRSPSGSTRRRCSTELQARWSDAARAAARARARRWASRCSAGLLGPGAGLAGAGGLPRGARVDPRRAQRHRRRARPARRARPSAPSETRTALGRARPDRGRRRAARTPTTRSTAAVAALPADSLLRARLEVTVTATDPRADLATITANLQRVVDRFDEASATIAATTPPDRSEVSLVAGGLGAAFAPAAPVLAKGREALRIVGIESLEHGLGPALADALEQIGPEPILAPFAAVVQSLEARLVELVHDGVVVPLTDARRRGAGADRRAQRRRRCSAASRACGRPARARRRGAAGARALRRDRHVHRACATRCTRSTRWRRSASRSRRCAAPSTRSRTEFAPSKLLAPVVDGLRRPGRADRRVRRRRAARARARPRSHELQRQIDGGMDEVIDALAKLKDGVQLGRRPDPRARPLDRGRRSTSAEGWASELARAAGRGRRADERPPARRRARRCRASSTRRR